MANEHEHNGYDHDHAQAHSAAAQDAADGHSASCGHDHTDDLRKAVASARWHAATHAVQSGVAAEISNGSGQAKPKHLRVGVNVALRDHASLVELLVAKGVITEVEYLEAIAVGMETEQADYEARLTAHYGRPVHLG